jgi:hypothetical protein
MPSKVIRAAVYDENRNELTVTFARGTTYVYSLVPATLAVAFAASETKGAFHNRHIRDRYPVRKARAVAPPSGALRAMLEASVGSGGEASAATPASGRSASQSDGSRGRG